MRRSTSFPTRLGRYIITAASILFFICMFVLAALATRSGKTLAVENSEKVLQNAISDVNGLLNSVEATVKGSVWVISENMDNADYLYDIVTNIVRSNDIIIGSTAAFEANYYPEKGEYYSPYAYRATADSEINTMQLGSNDNDYFTSDWYQLPLLLERDGWSEPYFDEGGAQQMMTTYSTPVRDTAGRVVAILTADISLEALTDRIASISPYENSSTIMVGNCGAFLIHWDPERLLNSTIFSTALEMESEKVFDIGLKMVGKESGSAEFKSEDGKSSFISYGSLSNGWSVGVISSYSDVFASAKKLNLFLILAMIFGFALLYFIVWKLIKRLTAPIIEFAYSAQSIAKGNFKARIPEIQTNDELKRLQESLSYMEKSIDNYISELRTTTAVNEKMGRELSIASSIQMHMLPHHFPKHKKFDLFASVHPAKEVGGDLYDFYQKGNKLFFLVGDVSGKGVPAALFMAITRFLFHYIVKYGHSLEYIISKINDSFADGNESGMFVTLFGACIDLDTYEMTYCNGGHNPIIIIDPDGRAEYLHAKANIAVGLFENFPYVEESIRLKKGSRIVAYTDGVSEAETRDKVLYGDDRLIEFTRRFSTKGASSDFVEDLLANVKAFTKGNDQNDDITIMSILLK